MVSTDPKIVREKDGTLYIYIRYEYDGKKIKKVFKKGINYYKGRERMREAVALRDALRQKLKDGWNPITRVSIRRTLIEILEEVLMVKKLSLRKTSNKAYSHILGTFKSWLHLNGLDDAYVFTNAQARVYLDYLLKEKKYNPLSRNIHMTILKGFFNFMLEREWIDKNPFMNIKSLPRETGKNVAYSDLEREKVKNYLLLNNKNLYYAVQFIYFCFLRRSELVQLKVEDIDFNNKTLTVHSSVSKSKRQESVTIPKSFEPILYEMGLDKLPPETRIFDFTADELSSLVTEVNKTLGITGKSIYAFKHSGCIALYNATKDPILVQRQARHSDVRTTLIYLRSLGLTVDKRVREADFKF